MKTEDSIENKIDAMSKDLDSYDVEGTNDQEIYPSVRKEVVMDLPVTIVYPNPDQPRKTFDKKAIAELADSIMKHGVIMPIVVNKTPDGYMIIAGERRYRASLMAGKKTIPAIVKKYTEQEIDEVSLIENLQREDLNPIEAANAMKQLMINYNLTQEELSERIGKSRTNVSNTLRLLTLNKQVINMVAEGKLSAGHARALITLPQNEQIRIATKVVQEKISVRDVEKAVKKYFNPPQEKSKYNKISMSLELKDLINRMQEKFGTKVAAIGNDNKGRIYIDYYSRDDLDRISELMNELDKIKE